MNIPPACFSAFRTVQPPLLPGLPSLLRVLPCKPVCAYDMQATKNPVTVLELTEGVTLQVPSILLTLGTDSGVLDG